jgi:hypothetical protein
LRRSRDVLVAATIGVPVGQHLIRGEEKMKTAFLVASCLLITSVSVPLHADIVSFTGQVSLIPPPPDARVNSVLESNTVAPLFIEQIGHVLGANLTVDFTSTGLHNANPVGPLPVILASTEVDSFYLVSDPIGSDPNNNRTFSGSITFSTDILGVVALDPEFASSNGILGHSGTLYSNSGVGLELGAPDNFTISADRRTITFAFESNTAADDLRIVTASSVPEPSSILLLGTIVAIGLGGAKRKLFS